MYNAQMLIESYENSPTPTVEVENTVKWVNPNLYLPFPLEVGYPTPLGPFLVNSGAREVSQIELGINYVHGRSSSIGRIGISDTLGNIYRDVDLKGNGFSHYEKSEGYTPLVKPISIRDEEASFGTWRLDKAMREIDITEALTQTGARTYRIGAIIELHQIAFPNGDLISVEEAKNRGLIHPTETPVIGVRLYRNRERAESIYPNTVTVLKDAKALVEKELGEEMNWHEYLQWFASSLGETLGKIHASDYWHGSLDPHNITLSSEVVDFGMNRAYTTFEKRLSSLAKIHADSLRKDDFRRAFGSLKRLIGAVSLDMPSEESVRATDYGSYFRSSYRQIYGDYPASL